MRARPRFRGQGHQELARSIGNSNRHTEIDVSARAQMQDSDGLSGEWWHCPAAERFARGYTTGGNQTTYIYIGGSHNHFSNANTYGWRHINRNWPRRNFGWIPQRSMMNEDSRSVMPFFMLDVSYSRERSTDVTVPNSSNHARPNSMIAQGLNILFLDGHVEWHDMSFGETWRFGGSACNNYWWNLQGVHSELGSKTYAGQ